MDEEISYYEDLLRASVDWTWETDRYCRIVRLSPGFDSILGTAGRTLIGQSLVAIASHTEDANAKLAQRLEEVLSARRPFRHIPLMVAGGEGRPVRFLISGLAFYDPQQGTYEGHRGTAVRSDSFASFGDSDTQANRQLLRLLEAALERKDELERFQLGAMAKDDWAKMGSLAHELRTPLNAIVGFAEIIRDRRFGDDLERYRHYAGLIYDGSQHLIDVVQDLANLTEREQLRPSDGLVDPAKIASFVLIVMEEEALRKGVKLVNDLPSALAPLRADRRTLRQILLNLVDNAVKYTNSGGEVRLSAEDLASEYVAFTVTDTGVGIAAQDHERIFERHVRVASGDQAGNGKGLGLSIARQLARDLGGDITVESKLGAGSTFTLRLPVAGTRESGPEGTGGKNQAANSPSRKLGKAARTRSPKTSRKSAR